MAKGRRSTVLIGRPFRFDSGYLTCLTATPRARSLPLSYPDPPPLSTCFDPGTGQVLAGCDDQHLVAAALELVENAVALDVQALADQLGNEGGDVRGRGSVEGQQRKYPDLTRYAQQFCQGLAVEVEGELRAVEKKQMGTEGEIEAAGRKRKFGQRPGDVASCAGGKIGEETLHGGQPQPAQSLHAGDGVPAIGLLIGPRLGEDDGAGAPIRSLICAAPKA